MLCISTVIFLLSFLLTKRTCAAAAATMTAPGTRKGQGQGHDVVDKMGMGMLAHNRAHTAELVDKMVDKLVDNLLDQRMDQTQMEGGNTETTLLSPGPGSMGAGKLPHSFPGRSPSSSGSTLGHYALSWPRHGLLPQVRVVMPTPAGSRDARTGARSGGYDDGWGAGFDRGRGRDSGGYGGYGGYGEDRIGRRRGRSSWTPQMPGFLQFRDANDFGARMCTWMQYLLIAKLILSYLVMLFTSLKGPLYPVVIAVSAITDPLLGIFRAIIPSFAGFDISFMLAFYALTLVRQKLFKHPY